MLIAAAQPRALASVIVCAHQGGGTLAFTYRAEWPHADATRFAVNYLRMFATDPAERAPRPPRRARVQRTQGASQDQTAPRLTQKGLATRSRIVDTAAVLVFERGWPTPASTRCAPAPR